MLAIPRAEFSAVLVWLPFAQFSGFHHCAIHFSSKTAGCQRVLFPSKLLLEYASSLSALGRVASRNFGGLRAFAGSCPFPSIQLQMATPTSLRCKGSPLQAPKHHHSSTGVWWWKPRLNLWKIWLEKSSGMNKVTAPTWQQETPQTANLRGCVRKGTFHMVPVKERESGQRPKGGYLCEVAVNETSLLSVHAPTFCTQCPELHLQRTSLKSVGTCHSLSSKLTRPSPIEKDSFIGSSFSSCWKLRAESSVLFRLQHLRCFLCSDCPATSSHLQCRKQNSLSEKRWKTIWNFSFIQEFRANLRESSNCPRHRALSLRIMAL